MKKNVLQNVTVLLQTVTVVKKFDRYYKLKQDKGP